MSRRLPRTSLINHSPGWSLHRKQASRTEDQVLVLRPASGQTTPSRNCGGDGVVAEVTGGGSCCTAMGAVADRPRNSIETSLKGVEKFSLPLTLCLTGRCLHASCSKPMYADVLRRANQLKGSCASGVRGASLPPETRHILSQWGLGMGPGRGLSLGFGAARGGGLYFVICTQVSTLRRCSEARRGTMHPQNKENPANPGEPRRGLSSVAETQGSGSEMELSRPLYLTARGQ
ncbi:hypothetical protein EDB80DRAFT_100766 [Ilyonectria destructans]|nr:hypothetical protein EDB80DRAFT_100766 [Ilyonectria destructans]